MRRFLEVFGCHSAFLMSCDAASREPGALWSVNLPEVVQVACRELLCRRDSPLAVSQGGAPHFVSGALIGDPALNEWRQDDCAHEATGVVSAANGGIHYLVIQRRADQGRFTREQLALFNLFLPHLCQSLLLLAQMQALQTDVEQGRQALDQMQRGVLLCDAQGHVIFRNRAARELLAANPGMLVNSAGRLSFTDEAFNDNFERDLAAAMRASAQGQTCELAPTRFGEGDARITVEVSPLVGTQTRLVRHGAIICLYDLSWRPKLSPSRVSQFFGLSGAEARVAMQVAGGAGVPEIAERLCRSRETIRVQLKAVFRKTRTSRQGELAALLTSVSGLY
ncbi:MAG: PAS domain-containing protein [Alcanivorax sp.]|nr:PAS domain-containing protein [Alcanivorax sp.]